MDSNTFPPSLLNAPAPLPDEWTGSWLARLAHENLVPLPRLLSILGLDRQHLQERELDDAEISRLAHATDLPAGTIRNTMLSAGPEGVLTVPRAPGHRGKRPNRFLTAYTARFCPACLKNDEVPYLRRRWQYRLNRTCEHHRSVLEDTCRSCGTNFVLLRTTRMYREPRPGATRRETTDLRTCRVCKADLAWGAAQETKVPSAFPLLTRHRLGTLYSTSPEQWLRLVDAFHDASAQLGFSTYFDQGQPAWASIPSSWGHLTADSEASQAAAFDLTYCTLLSDAEPLQRLRQVGAHLITSTVNIYLPSSRLMLATIWLAEALLHDSPERLVTTWPRDVRALVHLIRGGADPRETCGIAHVDLKAGPLITDDQWDTLRPTLTVITGLNSNNLSKWEANRRRHFETLLYATAVGSWQHLDRQQFSTRKDAYRERERLIDHALLGPALGSLYRHLRAGTRTPATLLARATAPEAQEWRRRTTALFLSDGMIELARITNPALHRELLGILTSAVITTD
ncbi:TniQ family protein [Deinococcus pimensis]|uniref:TniQ family protein n=1 Tax=Deinococcus pimensis TaxID=309888 RepID=UPI00146FAB90|nr:TniQ family protein [Deinococcus pimensis]